MHDIDRAMFEYEQEAFEGESSGSYESMESNFESEAQEMELAGRLLDVSSEAELEQFLGNILSSAASAARSFAGSKTGQALGGVLKDAARAALPQIGGVLGKAAGGMFGSGAADFGNDVGTSGGKWLAKQFELEGLSSEDREFEVARAVVRIAQDATRTAEQTTHLPPQQAALKAVVAAARESLPGLVPILTGAQGQGQHGSAHSGRWIRQGNRIVILGA